MIKQANIYTKLAITLFFYFILEFIPLNLYAEEPPFYTIQTGSFIDIKSAQKQFESIVKRFNEKELAFIRIEKIGKYYSPRLGKFKDYETADKFLQTNMPQLKGAIIIKAKIIKDRIIQLYTKDSGIKDITTSGKSPSSITPDGLKDMQLLEQPLPAHESNASVPSKDSVGKEGYNNELKDAQLLQKPSPADDTGILSNVKGRFYVSDYYSNDSDDFEFHILTSRLKLYKNGDKKSRYYYSLDARVRKKIFNGDLEENVPEWKVDEAWVGIKFPKQKLDVIGGRQYIYELYNTRIDGLNVKFSFDNGLGFGGFGGIAPDKQDESLNTD